MSPTHQWYGFLIFSLMIAVSLAIFAQRAFYLFRLMNSGTPAVRWDEVGQRLKGVLPHAWPASPSARSLSSMCPRSSICAGTWCWTNRGFLLS